MCLLEWNICDIVVGVENKSVNLLETDTYFQEKQKQKQK